MNKNKLTILGIIVLLIAVIGGGFWYVNKEQGTVSKEQSEIAEQREGAEQNKEGLNNQTEDSQKQEDEQENQEILNAQKQREMMFKKFTSEEAEKLQKEKDLVWYEIPELGVEFLVTKDTKQDLDYYTKEKKVYLFRRSVIEFNFNNWCEFNPKTKENNCSSMAISLRKNTEKKGHPGILCNKFFEIDNSKGVCFVNAQASSFVSVDAYYEYLKLIKDKDFGNYLGTLRKISDANKVIILDK
jgi:hypothetical protein